MALAKRLTDTTAHLADTEARLAGHLWRLTTAWECLDVVTVQRQLHALAVLAEESGSARVAFFAASRRAMAALVLSGLEEADRVLADAEDAAAASGEPDAAAVVHSLRSGRARRARDEAALAAEASEYEDYGAATGIASVVAEAGVLWLAAGRPDRAGTLARRVAAPGLTSVPRDVDFLLTVALVVEVAPALDDRALATQGGRLLEPYRGRVVLNAGAVAFHGVVDDYLYRARRRAAPEEANRWRVAAAAAYEQVGAPWWRDRVRADAAEEVAESPPSSTSTRTEPGDGRSDVRGAR